MISEGVNFLQYSETGTFSTGVWIFFANAGGAPEKAMETNG